MFVRTALYKNKAKIAVFTRHTGPGVICDRGRKSDKLIRRLHAQNERECIELEHDLGI